MGADSTSHDVGQDLLHPRFLIQFEMLLLVRLC